jgi:hypothetical protein
VEMSINDINVNEHKERFEQYSSITVVKNDDLFFSMIEIDRAYIKYLANKYRKNKKESY